MFHTLFASLSVLLGQRVVLDQPGANPVTGDSFQPLLWIGILVVCAVIILILLLTKKKDKDLSQKQ